MRSKRRSTCGVPAMYNDLSQSSQTTDSMDTQSLSEFAVSAAASSFSVLKEEDALLEPPVILQQTEVLNELPGNGNQIVGMMISFSVRDSLSSYTVLLFSRSCKYRTSYYHYQ